VRVICNEIYHYQSHFMSHELCSTADTSYWRLVRCSIHVRHQHFVTCDDVLVSCAWLCLSFIGHEHEFPKKNTNLKSESEEPKMDRTDSQRYLIENPTILLRIPAYFSSFCRLALIESSYCSRQSIPPTCLNKITLWYTNYIQS